MPARAAKCSIARYATGCLAAHRRFFVMLDVNQITQILPHRYPMLMVDRIVEMETERIVGLKNVTANEAFFAGHFPGFPVMPGVLIVEAMAQVGGVLILSQIPDRENRLVLFGSIEQAKFRRPVVPGDQLRIEMQILKKKASVCKMSGRATVDGLVVAEAVMMCKLADKSEVEPRSPEAALAESGDGLRFPRD